MLKTYVFKFVELLVEARENKGLDNYILNPHSKVTFCEEELETVNEY